MSTATRCAVIALAAIALAGCSSSAGRKGASTPPAGSGAASGSSDAGSSGSSGTSGAGKPADAATRSAVVAAYATFFSSRSTTAQSQATLQHGASFTQALAEQAKSSYAAKSSAKVSSVTLASKDVADVTFTITSNGAALLKDTPGKAVRENGTWKVAASTFCALVGLEGKPPSACKDPAITALPD